MHSYGAYEKMSNYCTSIVEFKKNKFVSSINYNNFYGVQFHPEKSGKNGIKLINNFLKD